MSIRPNRFTTLNPIAHSRDSQPRQTLSHERGSLAPQPADMLPINSSLPRKFTVRKVNHSTTRKTNPTEVSLLTVAATVDIGNQRRFRSLRVHTEKVVESPQQTRDSYESVPQLTPFEREEVQHYEVYYVGQRRIGSSRDFTLASFDAKVSIGDSIMYRYEIVSGVGQGSFGQVFKAYDHKKQEHVALKIIRNEAKFNKQAKVEMRILEHVLLHDPKAKANIVQLKHAFFFRGHACLSFELLHVNLYELLKQLKFVGLSLDIVRRVCIQLLQGLAFLKRAGIIHCDLKPENVLLKQEHKTGIKIIDVGSGCYQHEQLYTYIQSRFYRAPEIVLGISYTPAIDVWSLGCMLCELATGYPLFPGESEHHQILMFVDAIGPPQEDFLQLGTRSHKFFDSTGKPKPNPTGKTRSRTNSRSLEQQLDHCKEKSFVRFVKQLLLWRPEQRLTPEQALLEPWIVEGLPEELRRQHIASVRKEPL